MTLKEKPVILLSLSWEIFVVITRVAVELLRAEPAQKDILTVMEIVLTFR